MPAFDVVGVGANSVDYVYRLPAFPAPDSPAAKLRIVHHAISPGGQTATTLCTCASLGLRARYVGATGSDDNGRIVREALTARGVDVAHVVTRDTINAFAVVLLHDTHGERIVLWDREMGLSLTAADVDPAIVTDARLVHVDDVDVEASIQAAGLASRAGIPVTSDIERVDERTEALVAAVTVPIFAEHVLEALTGELDVERGLRKVAAMKGRLTPAASSIGKPEKEASTPGRTYAGGPLVCVTLGARGAVLLAGDRLHHEPALRVEVVDTTGAGDVFRGAFITGLLRGDSPARLLRFANAAAAVSCTRQGAIAGAPAREEIDRLLASA